MFDYEIVNEEERGGGGKVNVERGSIKQLGTEKMDQIYIYNI